jgi:hypothetical protein
MLGLLALAGVGVPLYETGVAVEAGQAVMGFLTSAPLLLPPGPSGGQEETTPGTGFDSADFYRRVQEADTLEALQRASELGRPTGVRQARRGKQGRVGAVCRDGTVSGSTGGGACSGHGGVAHWVYADDYGQQAQPVADLAPPPDPFAYFWHFCVAVLAAVVLLALIRKAL